MQTSIRAACSTTQRPCTAGPGHIIPQLFSPCSTSYQHVFAFQQHTRAPRMQRGARLVTRMGIKAIEHFDGSFELKDEARSDLAVLLGSEPFCKQVAKDTQQEGKALKFADILFQPVPWSPQTKKGMPAEYEQYLEDPNFTIINIPPNFMFKAKIFKPSRLCAIYQAT